MDCPFRPKSVFSRSTELMRWARWSERNYRSDNPVSVGRHMHSLGRRVAKLGLVRERIFRLDVPIAVNFRGWKAGAVC
jgi:hypothetical protein